MTDCKSIIEHAAVMQKFFVKLLVYSDEKDMAASAGGGGKHGLLKGLNAVSKSMRRKIYRRPPLLGVGAVIRQCSATKHASM